MTDVGGQARLYWLVKESNVHLSLRMTELDHVTSLIADRSQQLCYVQAHAASVTFISLALLTVHDIVACY